MKIKNTIFSPPKKKVEKKKKIVEIYIVSLSLSHSLCVCAVHSELKMNELNAFSFRHHFSIDIQPTRSRTHRFSSMHLCITSSPLLCKKKEEVRLIVFFSLSFLFVSILFCVHKNDRIEECCDNNNH